MLKRIGAFACFALLAAVWWSGSSPGQAYQPPERPLNALLKPDEISCQGFERDTVFIFWVDKSSDDSDYRVERSVAGQAWQEIATVSPDSSGRYGGYSDTGADVSQQNRRYRVRAHRSSDDTYGPCSDICTNRRIYDPGSFRIFYGLLGTSDACPPLGTQPVCLTNTNNSSGVNVFVAQLNNTLTGAAAGFTRVGFDRSAAQPNGKPDKVPINVIACDGGGCAYNYSLALAPSILERPFDLTTRVGVPDAYLVSMHELFHFQQYHYGYPVLKDPAEDWAYEGQARSIQDKICIGANRSSALCFDDVVAGAASYVGEVQGYLGEPHLSLLQYSYGAALFWTYLTEKYGTSPTNDTAEGGINLIAEFWKAAAAGPNRDGVAVLNSALTKLGHSERFRDIWKDFAVANYAKDLTGSGVPAKYKYADMAQPGGNYGPVRLSLDRTINAGEAVIDTDETVYPWGARYYVVRPAAGVPTIAFTVTNSTGVQVYYTLLGIKGNDLAYEYNLEAPDLARTVINSGYDKVVLIVAGMDNLASYRYAVNGTQPALVILNPTTVNFARVGSHTSPGKLRVMVDLVRPDGTPLPGVDLSRFAFRVGTADVPVADILSSATVMAQHWFLLRAPTQSAAGRYDLQVRYSDVATGTQVQAVDYAARVDADNVLLIDKSGSMGAAGKMDAAKAAARLFVDSWQTGDKIGVISFHMTPTVDMALTNWTDTSRQSALTAINALAAGGGTNIGDTLRMGWNQLTASGNPAHDWSLVLLSDGKEQDSSPKESFDWMMHQFRIATGKRPVVNTVAVGTDADRPRMQRIASDTGGSYQYVALSSFPASSVKLNMDYRYRTIAAQTLGHQSFYGLVGPLNDGVPGLDMVYFQVEAGARDLNLSLSWEGLGWEGVLKNPSSTTVPPFKHDDNHIVWRVAGPAGGAWSLRVTPANAEYLVVANIRSDLTLEAYLTTPPADRKPGVAMPILAGLSDVRPILHATVGALVETPSGAQHTLQLFDDGLHHDGEADDGLYGTTFYNTNLAGSYSVLVSAAGTSPANGPFTRQAITAFHLASAADYPEEMGTPDWDGDGMNNEWEQRYAPCVDPHANDIDADPDNDGALNWGEYWGNTHPCNPDTDGGGEADGTDTRPHDPSNDAVDPPRAAAYAGIGRVFLKYAPQPGYALIEVLQGNSVDGPFTLRGQYPVAGTVTFTLTGLTNSRTYCFRVVAIDGAGHRSGSLLPACATPRSDPWPPQGTVQINGGASTTGSPHVTLQLWASDTPQPELASPGWQAMMPPSDTTSGVTQMMISNRSDMQGAEWQAYAISKAWTLSPSRGLAAVFVKYRDAAGNVSRTAVATIRIAPRVYLPVIRRA